MTRRPRVLFLCQTLPYPPDGGVWMRTYHVLRMLAGTFDVTALCFERSKRAGGAHDVAASCAHIRQYAEVESFALPQQASVLRFGWDHLRSLLFGRVYTTYLYESPAFTRQVRHWMKTGGFDIVHMDSLDLARYLPDCLNVPVVVVHHDIESELLARRAALERSRVTRAYLRHQAQLMRKVEQRWCPRVALNVVCSDRDAGLLERIAPGSRVGVVPNGVDVDTFAPAGASGDGIAYVGGTQPFPNLDALTFFCEDVLPHVRAARPDVRVRWIGRASQAEQTHYRERFGVELTGYVDDVRPLMLEARCHVVPLRVGGGTRVKILSAWALGRPVVTTSIGCEGLAARDGSNLLIRDDPSSMAKAIVRLLEDDELAERLGSAGRITVEQHYSWDVVARGMLEAYSRVASAAPNTSYDCQPAGCGPSIVRA